jgi:hypothetical protein
MSTPDPNERDYRYYSATDPEFAWNVVRVDEPTGRAWQQTQEGDWYQLDPKGDWRDWARRHVAMGKRVEINCRADRTDVPQTAGDAW